MTIMSCGNDDNCHRIMQDVNVSIVAYMTLRPIAPPCILPTIPPSRHAMKNTSNDIQKHCQESETLLGVFEEDISLNTFFGASSLSVNSGIKRSERVSTIPHALGKNLTSRRSFSWHNIRRRNVQTPSVQPSQP